MFFGKAFSANFFYCSSNFMHDLLYLLCSEDEPTPSKVAFGTNFLSRPIFPSVISSDYFGNTQTPHRGVPNL